MGCSAESAQLFIAVIRKIRKIGQFKGLIHTQITEWFNDFKRINKSGRKVIGSFVFYVSIFDVENKDIGITDEKKLSKRQPRWTEYIV